MEKEKINQILEKQKNFFRTGKTLEIS